MGTSITLKKKDMYTTNKGRARGAQTICGQFRFERSGYFPRESVPVVGRRKYERRKIGPQFTGERDARIKIRLMALGLCMRYEELIAKIFLSSLEVLHKISPNTSLAITNIFDSPY